MKSLVTARAVSFELLNGRLLFQNINCSLTPQVTALVGPNGIGKSCFARLIAGLLPPTSGEICRNTTVTYFSQHQTPPNQTVEEFLGFETDWNPFRHILLQNINLKNACCNLSGGQWMRVRLAQQVKQDFLILDEPTNNLDSEGRESLKEFIQHYQYGILLISHDRSCLRLCQVVLELSNKGIQKYGGGWDLYEQAKLQERQNLQKHLENARQARDSAHDARVKLLSRQEKRNKKGSRDAAKGGIPRIALGLRKRQAQATTGRLEAATFNKSQIAVSNAFSAYSELKIESSIYADLNGTEMPSQKLVAEAVEFNIQYENWVFPKNLNFCWRGNARIALKGPNGAGKSTLIKALQGEDLKTRGMLKRGSIKTLYLDQNGLQLDDSKSILENIRDKSILDESEIRNKLAQFLFFKDSVFQKVGSLSGGERLRASLAYGFISCDSPELLMLDEPTNNLDLVNIEFLENFVKQFQGALIVVSHDEVFLQKCELTQELDIGHLGY